MRSNAAILNPRMRLIVRSLRRRALSNWSACRTECRLRRRARRRLRSPHRPCLPPHKRPAIRRRPPRRFGVAGRLPLHRSSLPFSRCAFARVLTHNLIGYLSRFGKLRVISEQTSDVYRDRQTDVAHLMTDLGVQYAIVGRVQGTDSALRIDFQLVDMATRTNLWSDHLQRERSDSTLVADEA